MNRSKKVLILTCSHGSGHKMVSAALKDAFEQKAAPLLFVICSMRPTGSSIPLSKNPISFPIISAAPFTKKCTTIWKGMLTANSYTDSGH